MSLHLTVEQNKNYRKLLAHLVKTKDHPLKCPAEKEHNILARLNKGEPEKQIIRDLQTSNYTVQRIRRDYGLWGK